MKLYLHIGFNKTGTSSIQWFLNEHRTWLAEGGLLYPQKGVFSAAHYGLTREWLGEPPAPGIPRDQAVLEELRKEILGCSCGKIVLSSEYFILAKEAQVQAIADAIKEMFGNIKTRVIVYLRRHDTWFESQFNQAHKMMDRAPWEPDIRDYVMHALGHPCPESRYLEVLERWAKVFGEDSLIVRPFEEGQFFGGDLIADFLHIVAPGMEVPETGKSIRKNESLSEEKLYFAGLVRRMPPNKERNSLIARIFEKKPIKIPPAPAHFGKMSPSFRASVLALFKKDYETIARKYLQRDDGVLFFEKE